MNLSKSNKDLKLKSTGLKLAGRESIISPKLGIQNIKGTKTIALEEG